MTHGKDLFGAGSTQDDFKNGWHSHLICDKAQNIKRAELLPDINKGEADERVIKTAVKIIRDIQDFRCFDIQQYLDFLDYAENPNGEDINEVKKYNKIMQDMYRGEKEMTINDYYEMWLSLGISIELGQKVKKRTEELMRDNFVVQQIEKIYDQALGSYKHILNY